MTVKDFVIEAKSRLNDYLEKNELNWVTAEETEVVKANDERLHGLILRREGELYAATVYLDDFYEKLDEGEDLEDVLDSFVDACIDSLLMEAPPCIHAMDMTLDKVRGRLSVRLLDARTNKSYMDKRPYIDAGCGLVMIAYINSEESVTSEWKIAVTDDLVREMGCSKETVLAEAMANTMNLEKPVLCRLRDMVTGDTEMNFAGQELTFRDATGDECREPLVLTNTSSFFGAAVLFYPGMLEKAGSVIGGGYSIIPSSVHEVILIPDRMSRDLYSMQRMLLEGNLETVARGDFLSGVIYHYNPGDERIRIATADLLRRSQDDRIAS